VWNEVEGTLTHLQGEDLQSGSIHPGEGSDELAIRRKLRGAS
jgi:hypothetical protein